MHLAYHYCPSGTELGDELVIERASDLWAFAFSELADREGDMHRLEYHETSGALRVRSIIDRDALYALIAASAFQDSNCALG